MVAESQVLEPSSAFQGSCWQEVKDQKLLWDVGNSKKPNAMPSFNVCLPPPPSFLLVRLASGAMEEGDSLGSQTELGTTQNGVPAPGASTLPVNLVDLWTHGCPADFCPTSSGMGPAVCEAPAQ